MHRMHRMHPPLLTLDHFWRHLFDAFFRTVCQEGQKTITKMKSKMRQMINSPAFWPLAREDIARGVGAKSVRVFRMWFKLGAMLVGRFEAFRDRVQRKWLKMNCPNVSKGGFQDRVHAVHAISIGSLF